MNIFVTGGSGFIGTNLVMDLLKEGHKVIIYDKQISETYPNLCIVGDVRDREKLTGSMLGVDAVYHLAAEHRDDVRPVSLYYEVNVGGAENVVYAMVKNGINRLIYTSTVAVYGLNSEDPDESSPIKPFNDYGWSKYNAEKVFERWVEADKIRNLLIVRPTVIFGENNRGNVYNLLKQIASGRFVFVGSGKNKKSMGYVLNLSKFLTSLKRPQTGKHVYNYADKPDLSTEELVRITMQTLGRTGKIKYRIPYPIGLAGGFLFDLLARISGKSFTISSVRVKKFCADTRVSAEKVIETGFKAPYLLTDGLKRMISNEFFENFKDNSSDKYSSSEM